MQGAAALIAGQGWRAYVGPVIASLSRLLALVALMLAPLGAQAAAAPAAHAAVSNEHCGRSGTPDERQQPKNSVFKAHCNACAGLPALPAPAIADRLQARAFDLPALASVLDGRELEIATPPPRIA